MRIAFRFILSAAVIAVIACGCSTRPFCGRELIELRNSVGAKNAEIARREELVRDLQSRLERKDEELKAKDAEIQDLKAKLQNFGVF